MLEVHSEIGKQDIKKPSLKEMARQQLFSPGLVTKDFETDNGSDVWGTSSQPDLSLYNASESE